MLARLLIAALLFVPILGCSSDEKTEEKAAKSEAKTAAAPAKKSSLLFEEAKDEEIVIVMDSLAQKMGVELYLEADVVGTLTVAKQKELDAKFAPKNDMEGLLKELATLAGCEAKKHDKGFKIVPAPKK